MQGFPQEVTWKGWWIPLAALGAADGGRLSTQNLLCRQQPQSSSCSRNVSYGAGRQPAFSKMAICVGVCAMLSTSDQGKMLLKKPLLP